MPQLEYRKAELRSDGRTLFGIAAPYDAPATLGNFVERIARGAFARAMRQGSDVMLLRDHDMTQLLARTANRSLTLEDRSDGLHFTATLAEFTAADDALAQARAGLLAGCSIGFYVRAESWNETRSERTLTDVELIEISCVQSAVAYAGTSIAARHRHGRSTVSRDLARRRRALAGL
jgi:HK97 family phage prohead protease